MDVRPTKNRWLMLCAAAVVAVSVIVVLRNAAAQAPPTDAPADVTPAIEPADGEIAETADSNAAEDIAAIPTKSLLTVIQDGGPLMIPIGICSFILLVFVFERAIALRGGRVVPGPFVKRFLEQLGDGQLDRESALKLCEENRSPVAEVFGAAVNKWGKPAVEVEQAIIDAGERVTNVLRKNLRLLNGVSTICPLLGLLGTVTGMIGAFNTIATGDAMGRPELLAGGISQALLTTAAGLSVAIPALIAYLFFVGRVDALIMDIDAKGQKVVGLISAEALASPSESRNRRRKAA